MGVSNEQNLKVKPSLACSLRNRRGRCLRASFTLRVIAANTGDVAYCNAIEILLTQYLSTSLSFLTKHLNIKYSYYKNIKRCRSYRLEILTLPSYSMGKIDLSRELGLVSLQPFAEL